MIGLETVLLILGLALVYLLFRMQLQRAVLPIRMKLADRGEILLASPHLTTAQKARVAFMLDNAFNPWVARFAACILPAAPIMFAIRASERKRIRDLYDIVEDNTRHQFAAVASMFQISIFAASPIFAAIVLLEWMLITTVMIAVGRPLHAAILIVRATTQADRHIPSLRGRWAHRH